MTIKPDFDTWYEENEEFLSIECAESGADREMDFNFEQFCEYRYESEVLNDKSFDEVPKGNKKLFG